MLQFSQVSSDISAYGLTTYIDIDRDTAVRFGITPATIDNALYDSFGQPSSPRSSPTPTNTG